MLDKAMEFLALKIFPAFVIFVIAAGLIFGFFWCVQEIRFASAPIYTIEATLLSDDYSASTRSTHVAPIVSSKGVSSVIYTTGDPERFVTVWDCGKFGKLVSTDQKIFRFAKPISILRIQTNDYDTRIIGIKEE